MRKFMLPVAAMVLAGLFLIPVQNATAQTMGAYGGGMSSTTFGIKVGPNFSNVTSKVNGKKNTSDMLVGLQGGVYANLPIAPQFYIQPSLMYEGKGAKEKYEALDSKATVRLNYLTLPIDFLFKPEMPNGSGSWFVGVGPYLGYGISGKAKVSDGNDNASISIDPFKDNGNGDASLKRFDAGANVQIGYEMASGFNVGLNANLGLINIAKNGNSDNSTKNTSFGVTLGYTLGK